MSAKDQIKKLADFIQSNYPEHIKDGGAGDVAIEIIKDLQSQLDDSGKVQKNYHIKHVETLNL